jgi:hypothetical protein
MLAGAARMETAQFAIFSILVLVITLTVGGARAGLLQPALIHLRTNAGALVPLRHALVVVALATICLTAAAILIGGMPPIEAVIVGVSASLPVIYEWCRYRAISTSRRWLVAASDAARLAVVLTTFLPIVPATPLVFLIVIGGGCIVPSAMILLRTRGAKTFAPYREYRVSAGWQTLDFAVGQFVVSAPLIALSGVGADRLIAGVRLSQTLLGPLNLAFSAASTNIIADGATDSAHTRASILISRGWRASWKLACAAVIIVGGLIFLVWATGFSLRGVDHESLLWGIVFVGGATVLTGWAGIHGIVLRVLGHQASVTLVRIGIAVLTLTGFVLGYLNGGGPASIAWGFIANSIAAPLLFVPVALAHYRADTRDE